MSHKVIDKYEYIDWTAYTLNASWIIRLKLWHVTERTRRTDVTVNDKKKSSEILSC